MRLTTHVTDRIPTVQQNRQLGEPELPASPQPATLRLGRDYKREAAFRVPRRRRRLRSEPPHADLPSPLVVADAR
jgi:hypothetical protein